MWESWEAIGFIDIYCCCYSVNYLLCDEYDIKSQLIFVHHKLSKTFSGLEDEIFVLSTLMPCPSIMQLLGYIDGQGKAYI